MVGKVACVFHAVQSFLEDSTYYQYLLVQDMESFQAMAKLHCVNPMRVANVCHYVKIDRNWYLFCCSLRIHVEDSTGKGEVMFYVCSC